MKFGSAKKQTRCECDTPLDAHVHDNMSICIIAELAEHGASLSIHPN